MLPFTKMNSRGLLAIFLLLLSCTLTFLLLWGRLRSREGWFRRPCQGCRYYLPGQRRHVRWRCKSDPRWQGRPCWGPYLKQYAAALEPKCECLRNERQNNFTQGAIRPVSGTDTGFADTGFAGAPAAAYFEGEQ